MLDLRTAIARACSVQARMGDDTTTAATPEGDVPDLTLRCWLIDADGNEVCEVFPPYSGVVLAPDDDGSCSVSLRRPSGLVDVGRVDASHDEDFEGAVARALLASDLGMAPAADAPSMEDLRRGAARRVICPSLLEEARASLSEEILWDSTWTLGLGEREAADMERDAERALSSALGAECDAMIVSTRTADGELSFSCAHVRDLPLVGGDVIVMDVSDELVVHRPGSVEVARGTDRPFGALVDAPQAELRRAWGAARRACPSRLVEAARPRRSAPESLRDARARLAPTTREGEPPRKVDDPSR